MAGKFIDTNVLVYLASAEPARAIRAEEVVLSGGVISVQVLNELTNVARRKMHLTWDETRAFIAPLRALLDVRDLTSATHDQGLAMASRYGLSVYDGMIVASAIEAGCEVLFSEDMHDGLLVAETLKVVNPFSAL